ncbi:MAG TPA: response regulator [Pirellulaceae bacterium]|nr:response regulator [Pirellulaceae bacterium]
MQSSQAGSSVILAIDGDPLALSNTAAVLARVGYEVHGASNPIAARAAVRARTFDLIISDVHVSGESGLSLCRQLRLEPSHGDTPLMFVSSTQLPDIIRRVHDAGGTYYLRKPFDPNVLLELVDKALWLPHLVDTRIRRGQLVPAPHAPLAKLVRAAIFAN